MQDELLAMDDAWTLRDHLNTVRNVIDMNAKTISQLEYNAFGKLISSKGEKLPFRYTGKMFDDATGLQWNINRWYDSNVGRWISEDPIGFRGKDGNLYRYVGNGSNFLLDPDGLQSPPPPVPAWPVQLIWLCLNAALTVGTAIWFRCKPCIDQPTPAPSCYDPVDFCWSLGSGDIHEKNDVIKRSNVAGVCTRRCSWPCSDRTKAFTGLAEYACNPDKKDQWVFHQWVNDQPNDGTRPDKCAWCCTDKGVSCLPSQS